MPASFVDSASSSCSESVADLADVEPSCGRIRGVNDGPKSSSAAATAALQHEKALSLDELCRLTRFTRQEVRAFYRTLKQECPRGIVSEETLRDVYNRLFPEGNGALYARHVFRALDIHGSGGVTFTQLLLFLSTICKGTTQDRLRWIFRLYDMDGDGVIQLSELFALIWAIREMAGIASDNSLSEAKKRPKDSRDDVAEERDKERRRVKIQAERLFQRWDLNRDGLVTWDEFLASCLRDENLATTFNYFIA